MNTAITAQKLSYKIGPLLYMPALRDDIAQKLCTEGLMSAALCLEDTIRDDMVSEAEANIIKQLDMLRSSGVSENTLPLLFIRVRKPSQITDLTKRLGDCIRYVCGFILPKIDDITFPEYKDYVIKANDMAGKRLYIMPIIENPSMLRLGTRYRKLDRLYEQTMAMKDYILNIRIGGNDFCKELSLRSSVEQTIYDIKPVADLLSDIAVTFTADFTVSAPVWNYFDNGTDSRWKTGMIREMELDKAMGFTGKTIIHPSQIDVVKQCLKVSEEDFLDAKKIISNSDGKIQVIKSNDGSRMYETKIHTKWADKILSLAEVYGVSYENRSR